MVKRKKNDRGIEPCRRIEEKGEIGGALMRRWTKEKMTSRSKKFKCLQSAECDECGDRERLSDWF